MRLDRPNPRAEAAPRRFKTEAELSVEEHIEHQRTGVLPETTEFRAYVDAVLAAAGIDLSAGVADLDETSVEFHIKNGRQ